MACTRRAGVTSTIIGARTIEQLDDNLGALDVKLTPTQVQTLDQITAPALPFPADMLPFIPTVAFGGTTINGQASQPWPQAPKHRPVPRTKGAFTAPNSTHYAFSRFSVFSSTIL